MNKYECSDHDMRERGVPMKPTMYVWELDMVITTTTTTATSITISKHHSTFNISP